MKNREIKFRFWTGSKMINPVEFADVFIKGDGNVYVCHDLGLDIRYIHDSFSQQNDLITMQFTGLHDKNGKEVYEGDVIEYRYYKDLVEMKWAGNGFWIEIDTGKICPNSEYIEIKGNIYENKDLILNTK